VPGIYISWPFCAQKCTYCNFASGVFPRALESTYLRSLHAELGAAAWPWTPETVYLGGGTPSTIAPRDFVELLAQVPGKPWREATLEAAPGSIDQERIEAWRRAGITRVSLGVQSFVDSELRRTGRKHNAEIVAREVALLRANGIEEISIDLIAGLPSQTEAGWRESLQWVERLNLPHVSVYMLEVDEDSRLGKELLLGGVRYGAGGVPGEEEIVRLYGQAVEYLARMGLRRYEISNFARPGHESVHNLKYWRLEPYLGFGADAHSFDGTMRWRNAETAAEYAASTSGARLDLTRSIPAEERFFVGLRLMEGVEITPTERDLHGAAFERLISNGLLVLEGARLRLTDRGVLLSNEVFKEFIAA
jgi:oxygen-independent coproporphyrinogen-3 oxidase